MALSGTIPLKAAQSRGVGGLQPQNPPPVSALVYIGSNQSDPRSGRSSNFRVKKAGESGISGKARRIYTKGRQSCEIIEKIATLFV